jgi:hypothetical protein
MSETESTADNVDTTADSRFLRSIEFLTGENPNLGSFLLVVGIVTCVFVALFQFTLPTPISHLLTGGVLFVTVISAIFALLLDTLGYFDRETATDTTAPDGDESTDGAAEPRQPWVSETGGSAPLPPVLDFDAELQAYADLYDGDLPRQFDPFLEDYRRLKTSPRNRRTIASDLRADLNPIGALFDEGTEGHGLYDDIGERLFRYIRGGSNLTVGRAVFYDDEGDEAAVEDLANGVGRVELAVENEGETVDVEVTVQFTDATGAPVSSQTSPAGTIESGTRETVTADVFVPPDARRATTSISASEPSTTVARA